MRLTIQKFWSSKEIAVTVAEGEGISLICGPGGPSIDVTAIFRPHHYISLKPDVPASR